MDLYLADQKTLMVVISGAMHAAALVALVVGAELYIAGGWLLTGFLIAVFDIIPISLLPFIGRIGREIGQASTQVLSASTESTKNEETSLLKDKPSRIQRLVFFVPDLAVFLNNLAYMLLIFAIPPRIEEFTGKSLSTAVLLTTLIVIFSFVASMALSFVADRKIKPNFVMLVGNIVFYAGAILSFGSTTEFLAFPASFEIGSVLVGFGDAAVINIAIMSKFSLYEKWGVKTDGLAEQSTALFNLSFCISQAVGTVCSGLTITRESEIPTIVGAAIACVVNTVGLIFCISVK